MWLPCFCIAFLLCVDALDALSLLQRSQQHLLAAQGPVAVPEGFQKALVLSIDPESYELAEAKLKAQGVSAERVEGFDGRKPQQVQEALKLLASHANAESLHATVSNAMLCLHTPLNDLNLRKT